MPSSLKVGRTSGGGGGSMAKAKAKPYDEFVMTLDSDDDEVDARSETSEAGEEEEEEEEEESAPSTSKRKATLAEREKITGLKSAKKTKNEMQIDKTFTFDVNEHGDEHDGWDFSVKNGGVKGQGNGQQVTVDDIIERRRGNVKVNELNFTAFENHADEQESSEEDAQSDDDESDADSLEFGAGVVPVSDEGSDEDEDNDRDSIGEEDDDKEENNEEIEGLDSEEEDAEDAEPESEEETEVEKAKKAAFFAASEPSEAKEQTSTTFASLSLSRSIMRALSTLNFHTPTPIQAKSIPIALAGKDIVAGAVTGSGKTAAFLIPILERLAHRPKGRVEAKTRVLILTPTRELAVQCVSVGRALAKFMDVSFCLCVGGLSLKVQEAQLKERPEIVVATPGRLIDHVRNSASFGIDDVEILVMDEADRMLEEGFRAELDEIVKATPKSRQTMLFSATMTDDVDELVRLSMKRPSRLFVDPKRTTAQKLVQEFVRVRGSDGADGKRTQEETRSALLLSLCMRTFTEQAIIFVRSKKLAHQLRIVFGLVGLSAGELHGDLSQEQRLRSLQAFRDGKVDFLLATDLASRGLDIKGVQTVINFDMPAQLEMYLHRVGRTARAGRTGRSVTLVGEADRKMLKTVLKRSPAEQIRHRLVPTDAVAQMADRLNALRKEVEEVLKEEQEEKLIRQAEMEATKGQNLIEHHDEIMSRPKRTWFVGAQDKASQKNLAKLEYEAKMGKKHDRMAGLSRKKKRMKMAREEMEAEKRNGGGGGGGPSINASIRAAKKANRPKRLGESEAPKSSTKKNRSSTQRKVRRS